jgi:hypothetical protein
VHCSRAAIDHLLPPVGEVYAPLLKPFNDEEQTGQRTLYIIIRYIHVSTRYAMFGMEVEKTQAIDEAFQRALSELEPIRPKHKPDSVYRRTFW